MAASGRSPKTAIEVIVLPDPDSPTIAVVLPGNTSKLMSFTTGASNAIVRFCIESIGVDVIH